MAVALDVLKLLATAAQDLPKAVAVVARGVLKVIAAVVQDDLKVVAAQAQTVVEGGLEASKVGVDHHQGGAEAAKGQ